MRVVFGHMIVWNEKFGSLRFGWAEHFGYYGIGGLIFSGLFGLECGVVW